MDAMAMGRPTPGASTAIEETEQTPSAEALDRLAADRADRAQPRAVDAAPRRLSDPGALAQAVEAARQAGSAA